MYPHDYVVVDGRKVKPPRYYDKLLREADVTVLEEDVLYSREKSARLKYFDNTDERLRVKEQVARAGRQFFSKKVL